MYYANDRVQFRQITVLNETFFSPRTMAHWRTDPACARERRRWRLCLSRFQAERCCDVFWALWPSRSDIHQSSFRHLSKL